MSKYDLEHQYQLFLKRMDLSESTMHPTQKKQLRQTFYGACGQFLVFITEELSKLEEDKAIELLDNIYNQIELFFKNELDSQNK